MDYSRIFEMQRDLDNAYIKGGFLSSDHINEKRILAILVELGEFANEYSPFKYWKKSKKIDHSKLVEEFIDGIHFFATFINVLDIKKTVFIPKVLSEDQSLQLLHTFKHVTKLFDKMNGKNLIEAFEIYLGNAKLLNLSEEEVVKVYINKNKINRERIKNGY